MDRAREEEVPALRRAWRAMGAVASEVDKMLRYRWIEAPLNGGTGIVGKRVEEFIDSPNALLGVLTAWFQTIGGHCAPSSDGTPWIFEQIEESE